MRHLTAALLLACAVGSAGCADLTRPNEILIIAEPPPAPKAPPAPVAAAPEEGKKAKAPRGEAKQGGG
jgi:hypothetical protein